MTVPVFEDYEPACDCPCGGCAERRRLLAQGLSPRAGGHPAARGARRALVLVTAAGVALGVTGASAGEADADSAGAARGTARADEPAVTGPDPAPADGPSAAEPDPATPQGGSGPLYGSPSAGPSPDTPADPARGITRAEIISRAKLWVDAGVPYSMTRYWSDGYRQDCSGYVSMAWHLDGNEWTGSLSRFADRIAREDLQPGDILLFHNPSDPTKGSHVTIFGGWTDDTHSHYLAYEQTKPVTRARATPMAYWKNSDRYLAYRYKGVTGGSGGSTPDTGTPEAPESPDTPEAPDTPQVPEGPSTPEAPDSPGAPTPTVFPGAKSFGPGADNAHVTRLAEMLAARGGARFYAAAPGPRWGESDRRATEAFQRAQGWRGAQADGLPGPDTWRLLTGGLGKDIPAAGTAGTGGTAGTAGSGGTGARPAYPGADRFRPGRSGAYVTQLGERLVRRGYGRHYASGPGPAWGEADRRNVEDFQRAQGWRGSAADGYPGPETWRRLFA